MPGRWCISVEREATIGGHMAKFDKTFRRWTARCACSPPRWRRRAHPNIHLWSYSEVTKVDGLRGQFPDSRCAASLATLSRTFVPAARNAWTACVYKEPKFSDEFNLGLGKRKPVFLPFAQAIRR